MPLTSSEKAKRARNRMLDKAREMSTGTYITKFVAVDFQRMIRAEAAAEPDGYTLAVVEGHVQHVLRRRGECICITCGQRQYWNSGLGGMHTGHFLPSRRNSILFEEGNVAPQCSKCNRYRSGAPQEFRQWMLAVRGELVVERLEQLKRTVVQFSREELVDKRIEFAARLRAAVERMKQK